MSLSEAEASGGSSTEYRSAFAGAGESDRRARARPATASDPRRPGSVSSWGPPGGVVVMGTHHGRTPYGKGLRKPWKLVSLRPAAAAGDAVAGSPDTAPRAPRDQLATRPASTSPNTRSTRRAVRGVTSPLRRSSGGRCQLSPGRCGTGRASASRHAVRGRAHAVGRQPGVPCRTDGGSLGACHGSLLRSGGPATSTRSPAPASFECGHVHVTPRMRPGLPAAFDPPVRRVAADVPDSPAASGPPGSGLHAQVSSESALAPMPKGPPTPDAADIGEPRRFRWTRPPLPPASCLSTSDVAVPAGAGARCDVGVEPGEVSGYAGRHSMDFSGSGRP